MNDEVPRASKSEKKREANNIHALGVYLFKLPEKKLAEINMPDDIRSAIIQAKKMSSNGALRRQQLFIGKLLRSIDHKSIGLEINKNLTSQAPQKFRHRLILRYRDDLVTQKTTVADLCQLHPNIEEIHLTKLIHNMLYSNSERTRKTNYRLIFNYLDSKIDQDRIHE